MCRSTIISRKITDLKPYAGNPRVHRKRQIRQIAASIQEFGWTVPVLIDAEGGVIAGHGRLAAAKLLGLDRVPTLCLGGLSEAQIRAYIIADNRLAEHASWDPELLGRELQFLAEADLEFDLSVIGFETAEIDLLIEGVAPEDEDEDAEAIPDVAAETQPVSRPGDLWLVGDHRLLCGDTRERAAVETLMDGAAAQMVLTDPPYNVPIAGHVCGKGAIQHPAFLMAAGEMSQEAYQAFLTDSLANLAAVSQDGALHFVFVDWRHVDELLGAADGIYSEIKNLCIWVKENGGLGSLYRSQPELIHVFKSGKGPHINNINLGRHGRNRTNVWRYPGISSLGQDRQAQLAMHPTVKPIALVADAIRDCSHRGGIILDDFAGSGTILIAAEKTGRRAYALELDPRYVDIALRRWQAYTGRPALEAGSGRCFAEVAAARCETEADPVATATTGMIDGARPHSREARHDR